MIYLFIFSVIIASFSQILLKLGSKCKNVYINKYTIVGYCILLFSTLCTVIAYKKIPLSVGVLLETLSYIIIPILSFLILGEKLEKKRIKGMVLIILGIFIFSL